MAKKIDEDYIRKSVKKIKEKFEQEVEKTLRLVIDGRTFRDILEECFDLIRPETLKRIVQNDPNVKDYFSRELAKWYMLVYKLEKCKEVLSWIESAGCGPSEVLGIHVSMSSSEFDFILGICEGLVSTSAISLEQSAQILEEVYVFNLEPPHAEIIEAALKKMLEDEGLSNTEKGLVRVLLGTKK